MLNAATESYGSFSWERKFLDFIDAYLKNQEVGLQFATEMELHPETSVIARYWNIEFNDNME